MALSWVSDISGYAWNAIYNGLYHSDESQILPYQLVKAGAVLTKRKITNLMQGSGFVTVDWTGAVIGQALNVASINTGSGAMTFNQGVKTTDDVTFATVNTGQGATEVHLMNQNLRTNDSPTFAGYYSNNAYGNHRVSPTIVLNYTFGGSHATTQMPAMEVGMSAVVKYTPYSGDADNALVLPAGGVYVVAGSSSDSYGTAYTGALGGGSTIWLNSTSGSHSKYFFVVRVA
ncbi:MAG: hypothetical protein EOM31_13665 [Bacteroidia bacterium]|nr:hypothetical protein [Bacteroidia bacterium]